MISEEAIRLIQDTAVNAAEAHVTTIPGDNRRVIVSMNGTKEFVHLLPADRKHTINRLEDLAQLAQGCDAATLWHDARAVTLLFDHDDRRDRATMPLERTAVFLWLESIAGGAKVDQKQFIALLRTKLADAVSLEQSTAFLAVLQRIRFRRTDETSADVGKGREALGRSVEEECSGADQLPDEMLVTTQVYRNVEGLSAAKVRVFVQIDYQEQRFCLTPVGDAVALAIDGTQAELGAKLVQLAEGVGVYHGTP